MLPIGRATFEFEEFLAACEYDLGCSPETVAFYRKKITRFLKWAQQEKAEALDAHAVRQFFRWLKDQGLSDNGAHVPARAADVVQLPGAP
ncbi:MAG: site-specific integrase [bacterium]